MEFREGINGKKFFIILVIAIVVIFFGVNKYKEIRLNHWITDVKDLVRDPDSFDYINDLYISDGRHWQHILNDKEKEDYKKIYTAIKEHQDKVILNLEDGEFMEDLVASLSDVIGMDHPELLYFSYVSYLRRDSSVEIGLHYSMDEALYQENLQKSMHIVAEIKEATKDMDDYEKCKYVYEWMGKNNVYGGENGTLAHSAYSAFDKDTPTVCEGFAKASQIIFQNIGINSIYVVGRRNNSSLHAWNLVKIDGKYYCFDATSSVAFKGSLSDPICYLGFLVEDTKKYEPMSYCKKMLPKVNGKKYLYYEYNDFVISYSDTDGCYEKMKKIAEQMPENSVIEFKVNGMNKLKKHQTKVEETLGGSLRQINGFGNIAIFVK